jgi:hypothetical protein
VKPLEDKKTQALDRMVSHCVHPENKKKTEMY